MSLALANSLVSRISSLSPVRHASDSDETRSIESSRGSTSSRDSSIESCDVQDDGLRPNEHLAVLLPKHLWKPDSQASRCDTFLCRAPFSLFERRHHCRKCGGVFCGSCSTRSTRLLDTSNLTFFYPPRNVSIAAYDSPISPVTLSRVCNDCYDQLYGTKSQRSPVISCSAVPVAVAQECDTQSRASSPSSSSSLATPTEGHSPVRPSFRRLNSSPRIPATTLRENFPSAQITDNDLGELGAYPLRHASAICKATGGGRWEPKPVSRPVGLRIPGSKAPHDLELEREAAEKRLRRLNPVIKDGDFQLRAPREFEPHSLGGPITLSTF